MNVTQILEQVEGGDLVVNKGDESRPKDAGSEKRDLNTVEGLDAALKLAQVSDKSVSISYDLRLMYIRPPGRTR